jgi:heme oxygenase
MGRAESLSHQERRSPVHARLRRETEALHRALETELDLLAPALSIARYTAVLRAFHAYYAALEPRLSSLAAHSALEGFALRERAPRLRRDLAALGTASHAAGSAAAVPLPELSRVEHLAGCLYVIEGAALGGQLITRAVEQRLGLTPTRGCAFFAGDGAETSARWRAVLRWIEELAEGGASGDEIVGAARETFETLACWARQQGAVA